MSPYHKKFQIYDEDNTTEWTFLNEQYTTVYSLLILGEV